MGDTDDTSVHRGTKFSRYWYRLDHNTVGYLHGTIFQIVVNNNVSCVPFFVPFLIVDTSVIK